MSAKSVILPLLFFVLGLSGCKTISKVQIIPQQSVSVDGLPMLLGRIDRQSLLAPDYASWFQTEYNTYTVNDKALEGVESRLKGVSVEVFMGTWCSDSQRDVPRFYKIMDYLKWNEKNCVLIAVDDHPDRLKTSPLGEERGKNIEFVPTFIFSRNGTEIGRIVEMPKRSLEADMAEILTK